MKRLFTQSFTRWFLVIVVFAAVTRLYHLHLPKGYIFDEVYHALTAKLIARNDPRAYEWWNPPVEKDTAVDWLHPPLAKYTQALSMKVFGENEFGWRFSSAVFGTLVIVAVALLSWEAFEDHRISLLASGLAALDGLLLVESRIAMNDVHVTFFILLACFWYIRYRKSPSLKHLVLTGLTTGLAMASKWSGIFVLGIIGFFELVALGQVLLYSKQFSQRLWHWRVLFGKAVFLLFLPMIVYLLGYSHMFLQGKTLICEGQQVEQGKCFCRQDSSWWVTGLKQAWPAHIKYWESLEARGGCKRLVSHFSELNHQIWWYQTNLKATHAYQSRPLEWFLNLRPVWIYVSYKEGYSTNIYAQGNTMLFWSGAVAVFMTFFYLLVNAGEKAMALTKAKPKAKQKKLKVITLPPLNTLLFILIAYAAVWMPWQLSPRIMFFYHYTPAVPLLSILLAYWLIDLWGKGNWEKEFLWRRAIVIALVGLIALNFVVFYPNWTGIPVPKHFAESVYFFLPQWK